MSSARDEILGRVRSALGRAEGAGAPPVPANGRVPPRTPGDTNAEIDTLLTEIGKLGGRTRRIATRDELRAGIADLVAAQSVQRATLWDTQELRGLCIADTLAEHGVTIIPPHADRDELARCDLGVTGADGALPETGTLVLHSSPEQPRAVSLLPRVLLAILRPAALRADLHDALARACDANQFVFVTGPSRTADIELTLTIGVHGPGVLYVWCLEDNFA